MELITSRENRDIKRLCALMSMAKRRDDEGVFVCEGYRLCMDAIMGGICPDEIFVTQGALDKYADLSGIVEKSAKSAMISESCAGKISDTKNTQGVFAIFKKLDNSESAVKIKNGTPLPSRMILLDSIQDPGNLGAILRTCEAMGIGRAILSSCADPYGPKALRAGMGSIFRLAIEICSDMHTRILGLRDSGAKVYAAALTDGAVNVDDCDFTGVSAILIGNEGNGLSERLIEACTASVIIPMSGGAQSLNAAVAAGILIWEIGKR